MRPELSRKSKYYVPKNLYRQCLYFCRQYPEWKKELSHYDSATKAIVYDNDRIMTGNLGDSTASIAMRRYVIEQKKQLVDDTVFETAHGVMQKWLLQGVTMDLSAQQLINRGMPCGRKMYYSMRREFFWRLSKKI